MIGPTLCCDCDASYVGETKRALKTRVSEHCKAVEKMDFLGSALAEHAWKHDHHIDWTSACILDVESHYRSRLSREAIHSPLPLTGTGALCLISRAHN